MGDGETSDEKYLNTKEKFGHIWDFGEFGGSCRAFYLKLYGPNCCYCDDANFKEWDIHHKPATGTKASFVAFEDTTELEDKPILGAEHRHEDDTLFGRLKLASYDYYLHRENTSDIISHRINYMATAINGTILYGDFQVQHDIEMFASAWDVPSQCQGNILDCGCDDTDEVHEKFFKHDFALATAKASLAVSV